MEQQQSDVKQRTKYREPRKFVVIMHNDDETTFDFVIMVLINTFHKTKAEAENLALAIHNQGKAVVGVYSLDIAKSKIGQVSVLAKEKGFPLLLTYQPE